MMLGEGPTSGSSPPSSDPKAIGSCCIDPGVPGRRQAGPRAEQGLATRERAAGDTFGHQFEMDHWISSGAVSYVTNAVRWRCADIGYGAVASSRVKVPWCCRSRFSTVIAVATPSVPIVNVTAARTFAFSPLGM